MGTANSSSPLAAVVLSLAVMEVVVKAVGVVAVDMIAVERVLVVGMRLYQEGVVKNAVAVPGPGV